MSADTVDDLHNAEDLIGRLAAALRDRGGVGGVLTAVEDYCRPTCGAEGSPSHEDPEADDFCGCLCHNRDITGLPPVPEHLAPAAADDGSTLFMEAKPTPR